MAARTSASDSLAFDLRRIRCCRSRSPWTLRRTSHVGHRWRVLTASRASAS